MLAQIEHAEGWVLGKDCHNHDVATFLDGLHQRTDGNFYTCYLETYLIAFLTEKFLGCLLQGLLGDVEGVLDAAFASLSQAEVAYIGNEYILGARAMQNWAMRLPMVPAPLTTTFLPFTSVRLLAWAPTAEGSIMAP